MFTIREYLFNENDSALNTEKCCESNVISCMCVWVCIGVECSKFCIVHHHHNTGKEWCIAYKGECKIFMKYSIVRKKAALYRGREMNVKMGVRQ